MQGGILATESERESIIDDEQLRLLSIAYWIMGGFTALYSLFVIAYFGILSTAFFMGGESVDGPPLGFGWVFLGIGVLVLAIVCTIAGLEIAAGFWIRARRHRL